MGDTLKKVHPGDPLKIPAATFNTLIDVACDHLAGKQNATRRPEMPVQPPGVILTVRNDSGADCERFGLLGLDASVFEPEDNTADFSRRPVMSAIIPADTDHLGSFVVLLDPLAAGEVGRGIVQGAVYVQVEITDADTARWADVTDGGTTYLAAVRLRLGRLLPRCRRAGRAAGTSGGTVPTASRTATA